MPGDDPARQLLARETDDALGEMLRADAAQQPTQTDVRADVA